jgi:hypothetical protein
VAQYHPVSRASRLVLDRPEVRDFQDLRWSRQFQVFLAILAILATQVDQSPLPDRSLCSVV